MYYISKVTIKNVLSFKDFTVELKPGMNMIVGCNGAGKSNFLKILDAVINGNDIFLNKIMNMNSKIIINFEYDNYEGNYKDNFFVQWICHIKNGTCYHDNFEFMKDKNMFKNMLMVIKKKKNKNIRKDILVDNNDFCYYIHVDTNRLCKKIDSSYVEDVEKKNEKIDDDNFKNQCMKITSCEPELENKLFEMEAKPRNHTGHNFTCQLYKLRDSNKIKFFSQLKIRSLKDLFDNYIKCISLIMETNNYETNIKNEIKFNINTIDCFLKSDHNCNLIKLKKRNKLNDEFDYNLDNNLPCNDVKLYTPCLKLRIMFLTESLNRDIIDNIIKNNNYMKLGNKLYESLKYNNDTNNLYKQVNDQFKQIFDKNFEIKINDEIKIEHVKLILKNHNFPLDYTNITKEINQNCDFTFDFDLIDSKTKTILSDGEKECIFFLTAYYSKDSNILMMDEPFTHLHYQAKFEIIKILHSKDKGIKSQMIMVTHDTEMIIHDNIDNIIRLYMDDIEGSKCNTLSLSKNYHDTKMIFENPKILFSKKCLIVEGYHDYRFMVEFLKVIKNTDYCVVEDSGKNSKLYEILDKLKIPHKRIFDADVIYNKEYKKLGKFSPKNKCTKEHVNNNKITDHINKYNDHNIEILYKLLNNKILIWDKYIQDIEGLGRQLFPDDFKKNMKNDKKKDSKYDDVINCLKVNNTDQHYQTIIKKCLKNDKYNEDVKYLRKHNILIKILDKVNNMDDEINDMNNETNNIENNIDDNLDGNEKYNKIIKYYNGKFFQTMNNDKKYMLIVKTNKPIRTCNDFKNYVKNIFNLTNNNNITRHNTTNNTFLIETMKKYLKECNLEIIEMKILQNNNNNTINKNKISLSKYEYLKEHSNILFNYLKKNICVLKSVKKIKNS